MHLKTRLLIVMIIVCTLLLASCGITKVTYEKGFPEEKSPALTHFVEHLISEHDYFVSKQDDRNLYAKDLKKDETETEYYQYTDEQVEKYYQTFLKEKMTSKRFKNLRTEAEKELFQPIESPEKDQLPDINMKDDNVLHITTMEAKKSLDLPELLKEYNAKKSDDVYVDVQAVTDQVFQLRIFDKDLGSNGEELEMFVKQDLSDFVVIQDSEDLETAMKEGNLKDYQELFISVGDIDLMKTTESYWIWDKEAKEVQNVDEQDYLSENGEYVYLEGNEREISDGEQQIQRVDDYFADNDNYETEFKISFKKIAKELGLSTSGVGKAKVKYFNKDYIVLRLTYDGRIVGKAGATNVLIDLQDKENPTAHLIDLDWE